MIDLQGCWKCKGTPLKIISIQNPKLGKGDTDEYKIIRADNQDKNINMLIAEINENRFYTRSDYFGKTYLNVLALDEFVINGEKYQRLLQ